MNNYSVPRLQTLVSANVSIQWAGVENEDVVVKLTTGEYVIVSLPELDSYKDHLSVIDNNEGEEGYVNTSAVPNDPLNSDKLKYASIMGVNVYGNCRAGGMRKLEGYEPGCVLSYDIEVAVPTFSVSAFPLPSSDILSIAAACSCGLEFFTSVHSCDDKYDKSFHMTEQFIELLWSHRPGWSVGWNNYAFDNDCLLFHYPKLSHNASRVKVGSAGTVSYGVVIDIPGTYNVDMFAYLPRSHQGMFSSWSLGSVSTGLGLRGKMSMPKMDSGVDLGMLREYNLNDCYVALGVWNKLHIGTEIVSLALCSSSPVYDVCRYMTGSMMSCLLSSYALSTGKIINWNPHTDYVDFMGGLVLDSVKGLHKGVVTCDFSSMYPSIMIGCNMSPDVVDVLPVSNNHPTGDVWWDDDFTYVSLDRCTASFPRGKMNFVPTVAKLLVDTRNVFRREDPVYATSLKVCANSIYGAMGYHNSPLYCPAVSASVTTVGRFCVNYAKQMFEKHGLTVIAGDTDSCMCTYSSGVVPDKDETVRRVNSALNELHSTFADTPLSMMKMKLENYVDGMITVEKKHYCKLKEDGTLAFTGLSPAKPSVATLVKYTCRKVCEAILKARSAEEAKEVISSIYTNLITYVVYYSPEVSEISGLTWSDGVKRYRYESDQHGIVSLAPEKYDSPVNDHNPRKILEVLRNEGDRITVSSGLGTVAEIILTSSAL